MRRVAVTGVGCISGLGHNAVDFWRALRGGQSGIRPLSLIPPEQLQIRIGAEVPRYDASRHFDPKRLAVLDRFSQFAVIAAREAVQDAEVDFSNGLGRRAAVILGAGAGGITTIDESFYRLYGEGNPRVHPSVIPRHMPSAAASHVTMEYGITGPAFAVSSACSSASHAIGQAFWMVRHGISDLAIAGGSEACFTLGTMKAWEAMRVMAPDTCRPFSLNRSGMVLGEGAAIVVLEPFDRLSGRSAKAYAELAGFGMSSDAGHLIHPSEQGAVDAMCAALEDARLAAEQIDYINAHGTGTTVNDVTEARAIRRVFGSRTDRLAVSSTKSMHGHALGAAGCLELVATVLAIRHQVVPPTANFAEPDPECNLDCVPNQARQQPVGAALSNSFAFGGLNAVLAVRGVES